MNYTALRSTRIHLAMAAVAVMAVMAAPWLSMPSSSSSFNLGLGYGGQLDSNAFVVSRLEVASSARNTALYEHTAKQESLPACTRSLRPRFVALVRVTSAVHEFAGEVASLLHSSASVRHSTRRVSQDSAAFVLSMSNSSVGSVQQTCVPQGD